MIRVRHGALKQCVWYWWYEPDLTIWSLGSLSPGISVHFLGRGGGGGTLLVSLRSRFSVYTQHPHQSYIYQSINQSQAGISTSTGTETHFVISTNYITQTVVSTNQRK